MYKLRSTTGVRSHESQELHSIFPQYSLHAILHFGCCIIAETSKASSPPNRKTSPSPVQLQARPKQPGEHADFLRHATLDAPNLTYLPCNFFEFDAFQSCFDDWILKPH